jgi:GDPmannose 4,6-dehydratase
MAFGYAGLDWRKFVRQDPALLRPAEVDVLQGDASKALVKLGWAPHTTLEQMVTEMVEADLVRHRARSNAPTAAHAAGG